MADAAPLTILCIASYEKGRDFMRECKKQGCRVLLLTSLSLKDSAEWPMESIDEIFFMPDEKKKWNTDHALRALCHLGRTVKFDRMIALDDFDLEHTAKYREHFRLPGLGESATRFFRDKLAMRMKAREFGIGIPDFVPVLHDPAIHEFLGRVPSPWLVKPRLMAGAIGIKKIYSAAEVWSVTEALGDERSYYLIEQFIPGDIFHVDSIVYNGEVRFAVASKYGAPPLEVSHGGGIFTTRLLERGSDVEQALLRDNRRLLTSFGLEQGVSHTEFLLSRQDGRLLFLETSARVGGANIADLVEAATGINMWAEWAKVETSVMRGGYEVRPLREEYSGLLVSLARQEHPDTSEFNDPEIVWRMKKNHHVGLIVRSPHSSRVQQLLQGYTARVAREFHAVLPPQDRPTN